MIDHTYTVRNNREEAVRFKPRQIFRDLAEDVPPFVDIPAGESWQVNAEDPGQGAAERFADFCRSLGFPPGHEGLALEVEPLVI